MTTIENLCLEKAQAISTAILQNKDGFIYDNRASGKTTAIIQNIRQHQNKKFLVFVATRAVHDIYKHELRNFDNYKLVWIKEMDRPLDGLRALRCDVAVFDDMDVMIDKHMIAPNHLNNLISVLQNAKATIIETNSI